MGYDPTYLDPQRPSGQPLGDVPFQNLAPSHASARGKHFVTAGRMRPRVLENVGNTINSRFMGIKPPLVPIDVTVTEDDYKCAGDYQFATQRVYRDGATGFISARSELGPIWPANGGITEQVNNPNDDGSGNPTTPEPETTYVASLDSRYGQNFRINMPVGTEDGSNWIYAMATSMAFNDNVIGAVLGGTSTAPRFDFDAVKIYGFCPTQRPAPAAENSGELKRMPLKAAVFTDINYPLNTKASPDIADGQVTSWAYVDAEHIPYVNDDSYDIIFKWDARQTIELPTNREGYYWLVIQADAPAGESTVRRATRIQVRMKDDSAATSGLYSTSSTLASWNNIVPSNGTLRYMALSTLGEGCVHQYKTGIVVTDEGGFYEGYNRLYNWHGDMGGPFCLGGSDNPDVTLNSYRNAGFSVDIHPFRCFLVKPDNHHVHFFPLGAIPSKNALGETFTPSSSAFLAGPSLRGIGRRPDYAEAPGVIFGGTIFDTSTSKYLARETSELESAPWAEVIRHDEDYPVWYETDIPSYTHARSGLRWNNETTLPGVPMGGFIDTGADVIGIVFATSLDDKSSIELKYATLPLTAMQTLKTWPAAMGAYADNPYEHTGPAVDKGHIVNLSDAAWQFVLDWLRFANDYDFTTVGTIATVSYTGPTLSSGSCGATMMRVKADYDRGSATGSRTLYVAVEDTGVYKSTDAGVNWTLVGQSSSGLTDTSVISLALTDSTSNTIVVGTREGAIFRSTDAGVNWSSVTAPAAGKIEMAVAIGHTSAAKMYAICTDDWHGSSDVRSDSQPRLYYSTDSGASWTAGTIVQSPLSPLLSHKIDVAHDDDDHVVFSWILSHPSSTLTDVQALGYIRNIKVFRSEDAGVNARGAGANWTSISDQWTGQLYCTAYDVNDSNEISYVAKYESNVPVYDTTTGERIRYVKGSGYATYAEFSATIADYNDWGSIPGVFIRYDLPTPPEEDPEDEDEGSSVTSDNFYTVSAAKFAISTASMEANEPEAEVQGGKEPFNAIAILCRRRTTGPEFREVAIVEIGETFVYNEEPEILSKRRRIIPGFYEVPGGFDAVQTVRRGTAERLAFAGQPGYDSIIGSGAPDDYIEVLQNPYYWNVTPDAYLLGKRIGQFDKASKVMTLTVSSQATLDALVRFDTITWTDGASHSGTGEVAVTPTDGGSTISFIWSSGSEPVDGLTVKNAAGTTIGTISSLSYTITLTGVDSDAFGEIANGDMLAYMAKDGDVIKGGYILAASTSGSDTLTFYCHASGPDVDAYTYAPESGTVDGDPYQLFLPYPNPLQAGTVLEGSGANPTVILSTPTTSEVGSIFPLLPSGYPAPYKKPDNTWGLIRISAPFYRLFVAANVMGQDAKDGIEIGDIVYAGPSRLHEDTGSDVGIFKDARGSVIGRAWPRIDTNTGLIKLLNTYERTDGGSRGSVPSGAASYVTRKMLLGGVKKGATSVTLNQAIADDWMHQRYVKFQGDVARGYIKKIKTYDPASGAELNPPEIELYTPWEGADHTNEPVDILPDYTGVWLTGPDAKTLESMSELTKVELRPDTPLRALASAREQLVAFAQRDQIYVLDPRNVPWPENEVEFLRFAIEDNVTVSSMRVSMSLASPSTEEDADGRIYFLSGDGLQRFNFNDVRLIPGMRDYFARLRDTNASQASLVFDPGFYPSPGLHVMGLELTDGDRSGHLVYMPDLDKWVDESGKVTAEVGTPTSDHTGNFRILFGGKGKLGLFGSYIPKQSSILTSDQEPLGALKVCGYVGSGRYYGFVLGSRFTADVATDVHTISLPYIDDREGSPTSLDLTHLGTVLNTPKATDTDGSKYAYLPARTGVKVVFTDVETGVSQEADLLGVDGNYNKYTGSDANKIWVYSSSLSLDSSKTYMWAIGARPWSLATREERPLPGFTRLRVDALELDIEPDGTSSSPWWLKVEAFGAKSGGAIDWSSAIKSRIIPHTRLKGSGRFNLPFRTPYCHGVVVRLSGYHPCDGNLVIKPFAIDYDDAGKAYR